MENLENQKSPEKKEKPLFFYHGSPHRIEELKPRTKPHREKEEGPLVFATPDIKDAAMFLRHMSMTGHFMVNGEKIAYAIVAGTREEFLKNDDGGHIHVLPNDTFEPSPHEGMSNEWVSKVSVKPVKVIEYGSGLDAMLEYGVQVYFVDNPTLQKIRDAQDHGYAILQNMQSENQRRGINIKEFK